jgi:hypothetical protein
MNNFTEFTRRISAYLDMIDSEEDSSKKGELILEALACNSQEDDRFTFQIGDLVINHSIQPPMQRHKLAIVTYRRNGYPPPLFDCWFPVYMINYLESHPFNGEEVGPGCIHIASDEEILAVMSGSEYY